MTPVAGAQNWPAHVAERRARMSAGLLCRWFLACDRLAEGYGAGPGGVEVPCCRRCADVVGIELLPLEAPPASGATITTTEDR